MIDDDEEFMASYYKAPTPERLPELLEFFLDEHHVESPLACGKLAGVIQEIAETASYFLTRAAHGNADAMRGYERVFCDRPRARSFILPILARSGDAITREFLDSCLTNRAFVAEASQIRVALQNWPFESVNALKRHITKPRDLDFLWIDFLATGDPQIVVRIIDVLEWQDRIRERLLAWLALPWYRCPGRLFKSKRRRARNLREITGILCDVDQHEIVTADDLDCLVFYPDNGASMSPRLFRVIPALPFRLVRADRDYIDIKVHAMWLLLSNAVQHDVVHQTCEAELARRSNRCRNALSQVVGLRTGASHLSKPGERTDGSLSAPS